MDDWSDEKLSICADILQILCDNPRQPVLIDNIHDYYPETSTDPFYDIVEDMVKSDLPIQYNGKQQETLVLSASSKKVQNTYEEIRKEVYDWS